MWFAIYGQRFLEPDHDISVMLVPFWIAAGIAGCQAIGERLKQFLLERSRNFRIGDQFKSRFDETADFQMEPQKAAYCTAQRSQHPTFRRWHYLRSGQGLGGSRKLLV